MAVARADVDASVTSNTAAVAWVNTWPADKGEWRLGFISCNNFK
jgi:hypothetical protein